MLAGETVEVPDAAGESLVMQGWKHAKKEPHKKDEPASTDTEPAPAADKES